MVADEDDTTEETTVVAAVDTGTIDIATTVEETEAVGTEGETGAVPWTIEATAEAIVIITTAGEEATATTTIVDAAEETIFGADAIDRPIGDLPGAEATIGAAVVLGADRHRAVETTAETTEVVEVTQEALRGGATTIAIGAATMTTEAVAATTNPVALRRCTAGTIVEETIAAIVARE
jgi:hypothetical protein